MNIDELTIPELIELSTQCLDRIDKIKDREIKRLRDEFEAKAETLGMTASGVLAFDAKKRRAPGTPKYRNPADPTQTWAGRGKQPIWLKEKLEAGANLEDFLIDKPEPVPEDTGF